MINQPARYTATRGATCRLMLRITDDPDGLITGAETVRAVGKSVSSVVASPPGDDAEDAFELIPSFAAASGGEPKRFYLKLSPAESEAVEAGLYAIDTRIVLASGDVVQPAHIVLELKERVSEAV